MQVNGFFVDYYLKVDPDDNEMILKIGIHLPSRSKNENCSHAGNLQDVSPNVHCLGHLIMWQNNVSTDSFGNNVYILYNCKTCEILKGIGNFTYVTFNTASILGEQEVIYAAEPIGVALIFVSRLNFWVRIILDA